MTLPIHTPVLVQQVLQALHVQPGKRYIDCTLGSGGHAKAILKESIPDGHLLGIDTDPEAIRIARIRLADYAESGTLVNDNFTNLEAICRENNFLPADGILFDLGISSLQLDSVERGFSFLRDAPLDMRFSPIQELTAAELINILPENRLAQLIHDYGEERYSRQIARRIVQKRPINTTSELVNVIEQVAGHRRGKMHPATRTFLALRIAINHELENLETALNQAINCLGPHGRLVVLSYHSLEDRIVKQLMKREAKGCICPQETQICLCGHKPTLELIAKKVITPSLTEIEHNPRSRSAKLRVAERLQQ